MGGGGGFIIYILRKKKNFVKQFPFLQFLYFTKIRNPEYLLVVQDTGDFYASFFRFYASSRLMYTIQMSIAVRHDCFTFSLVKSVNGLFTTDNYVSQSEKIKMSLVLPCLGRR